MKYIENKEYSKDCFVTGFSIVGKEIKIKFANGDKNLVLDCKENRRIVLERMNQQAVIISKQESEYKKASVKNKKFMPINMVGTVISAGSIALGTTLTTPLSEACFAASALIGVGVGYKVFKTISDNRKLNAITKTKFAIENKDSLNSEVKKSKNTLYGVSRKIKRAVKRPTVEGEPIDMNIVNRLSLEQLKKLKSNIDREKEFQFIYKTNIAEPEKVKGF